MYIALPRTMELSFNGWKIHERNEEYCNSCHDMHVGVGVFNVQNVENVLDVQNVCFISHPILQPSDQNPKSGRFVRWEHSVRLYVFWAWMLGFHVMFRTFSSRNIFYVVNSKRRKPFLVGFYQKSYHPRQNMVHCALVWRTVIVGECMSMSQDYIPFPLFVRWLLQEASSRVFSFTFFPPERCPTFLVLQCPITRHCALACVRNEMRIPQHTTFRSQDS